MRRPLRHGCIPIRGAGNASGESDMNRARRRCRDAARDLIETLALWPDLAARWLGSEAETIRKIANWEVED